MRHVKAAAGPLYTNCAVYPPDSDTLIFRCDKGRMLFYLENNLAKQVTENPPAIRLTFQPAGNGHAGDEFFTQAKPNRCVVCGVADDLTRHHIVPDAYRRHFPRSNQRNWSYDVLALCTACHGKYEEAADRLKDKIADEFDTPTGGWNGLCRDDARFIKACYAIQRHADKIPESKLKALAEAVRERVGDVPIEAALRFAKALAKAASPVSAGEVIVGRLKDVDDFAIRWRKHFLKVMKPKHLPDHWNPERRIYSEVDRNRPKA